MGVVLYDSLTPLSFVMGVLWFNIFVIVGLAMRKLLFPGKHSTVPLVLLLALSVLRIVLPFELPGSIAIVSENIYPTIVNIMRFELISFNTIGFTVHVFSILIFLWVTVATVLIIRYAIRIKEGIKKVYDLADLPRDEYAESILADMIGPNNVNIFRSMLSRYAFVSYIRPYIVLPTVDFTDDELRVLLRHEWKHYRNMDCIATGILDIIAKVFWWNPLAYVLKQNVSFMIELKCDYYAVRNLDDHMHYLAALKRMQQAPYQEPMFIAATSPFINDKSEVTDRLKTLIQRSKKSYSDRISSSICFSIVIFFDVCTVLYDTY